MASPVWAGRDRARLDLVQRRRLGSCRMSAISVTVRRGTVVEAVHRVHVVAVTDGRIADSAGDPHLVTLYRSSSKPLQALPLARERADVTEVELAIACASHRAEPP